MLEEDTVEVKGSDSYELKTMVAIFLTSQSQNASKVLNEANSVCCRI